ncbi:MAG: hypothetical protein ACI8ZB_001732 [Desulforhopalus sp.]|jgi:hypothetical protein
MLTSLIIFLKKHNERATIIGLGLALVVFVCAGLYLQNKNSKGKKVAPERAAMKVELQLDTQKTSGKNTAPPNKTGSFFLRPSPAELLEQLSNMENLQEDVAQSKLQHLRVLWSVYFFSVESPESGESILLDISEDGFGAQVRGSINSIDYPQLKELKPGDKIWVAGEIIGVDPSGTGTVYLNIEILDFSESGPPAAIIEPPVDTKNE